MSYDSWKTTNPSDSDWEPDHSSYNLDGTPADDECLCGDCSECLFIAVREAKLQEERRLLILRNMYCPIRPFFSDDDLPF